MKQHSIYQMFRVYPDGCIVKMSTVATIGDAILAQSALSGIGYEITYREYLIDFDPAEASWLA